MKCAVIYSSQSGNTRAVAEAILEVMPAGTELFAVHHAPQAADYDFLALGFWVDRAKPDPRMWDYMGTLQGKTVALFGTMSAWPDSLHAREVVGNAHARLDGNLIVGEFLCLGRLTPQRLERYFSPGYQSTKHPLTPDRRERLLEGARHPDAQDFARAREAFRGFMQRCEEGV